LPKIKNQKAFLILLEIVSNRILIKKKKKISINSLF